MKFDIPAMGVGILATSMAIFSLSSFLAKFMLFIGLIFIVGSFVEEITALQTQEGKNE